MIQKIKQTGSYVNRKINRTAKKCLLSVELAAVVASPAQRDVRMMTPGVVREFHTPNKNPGATAYWDSIAKVKRVVVEKNMSDLRKKEHAALVLRIMSEDKHCSLAADKQKFASQIVEVAHEYGVDPVEIACINKKESHFTPNLNGKTGKGSMQITQIVITDMFMRTNLYHEKLKDILKVYKTPKALFSAIQQKPVLNLRIGTILYRKNRIDAKGNIRKALENYNGSPNKKTYAQTVYNDINRYRGLLAEAAAKK